ncbi:alpha-1,6-mannosyl-glycoprotein 2-beta-N-acetylglucosaminyltransferase [Nematostella vectensis]|uniref:alpha-1,6-mannosyl-glycoprotein 2-beta-N-acetylglucosaminyltransferase n=1 Tax=Nematostella vectensis TaxID=45351 RepID=UPI0013901EB9|nr:alpha-1,6-mannosyl-glycoprotein 2-beta-N-acetylglucosaminyltransferase [Nematostella vectensis]
MLFKMFIPSRGMLSFRYRGTTIRTSAFKLFVIVFCTVSMVLFMRLQGLFLSMPLTEEKHLSGSKSLTIDHEHIGRYPVARTTSNLQEPPSIRSMIDTEKSILQNDLSFASKTIPTPYNLPSLQLNMKESTVDVEKIRKYVQEINNRKEIRNLEKFPGSLRDNSLVIIVQVHNRPDYFSQLIRSLGRARGIQNTLLVISHDFYNEEMDKIAKAIDFCKVLQIFFPYSMQLYPDQFPGTDPKDCPRDVTKEKAKIMKCKNADHPDKYGHFREAKFTMTKHHWWWKANTVFDGLNITKYYNGPVLFLEEDHYAAPDFYHIMRQLYHAKQSDASCANGCDIMTLGTYTVPADYKEAGEEKVELVPWKSVKHNMGMAFDRNTWNRLKNCKEMFCKYDDYNWDWTLMRMSKTCLGKPLHAMVMKTPRMFHIGECGLHHKKKQCDPQKSIARVNTIINNNERSFYPESLILEQKHSVPSNHGQPNGGWGDTRDHALCLTYDKSAR